jgi:hypothetical protein
MDTDEMFERGIADAYRGEAHPFYYEHYEPYKRAYDQTRKRMHKTGSIPVIDVRRWALNAVFVVGLVAIGAVVYMFTTTSIIRPTKSKPTPVILPTLASSSLLLFATNTPLPVTPTPLLLREGGRARIQNTDVNPLRVRISPSKNATVIAYFRDDENVSVNSGPILADGFVWWNITGASGTGWSAEHDNEGTYWIVPVP